jgi:hypothetical protein
MNKTKLQLYGCLQKLHLCVSYSTTLRVFDKLGEGYDAAVLSWKKEIESKVLDEVQYDYDLTQV